MGKKDFWYLIIGHLNGTLTEKEEEFLRKWLRNKPDNQKLFMEIKRNWRYPQDKNEKFDLNRGKRLVRDKLDKNDHRQKLRPKPKKKFSTKLIKIAAVFLMLIGLAGSGWQLYLNGSGSNILIAFNDTSRIELINLPDGSKVWLGPQSKLRYPRTFEKSRRNVALGGEAFFEVQHNPKKPFSVKTQYINTTVLGTSFKIDAFPAQKDISVAVVSGSVRVSRKGKVIDRLIKGEKIRFDKPSGSYSKETGLAMNWEAWKKGQLIFEGSNFGIVSKELERRYKVKIFFENETIKNCPITARFDQGKPIQDILKMLCLLNGTTYSKSPDGHYQISGKGCQSKSEPMQ